MEDFCHHRRLPRKGRGDGLFNIDSVIYHTICLFSLLSDAKKEICEKRKIILDFIILLNYNKQADKLIVRFLEQTRRCRVVGRARTIGNRVRVKSSSRVRISPSPPQFVRKLVFSVSFRTFFVFSCCFKTKNERFPSHMASIRVLAPTR